MHAGTVCDSCERGPIVGRCWRHKSRSDKDLCDACFQGNPRIPRDNYVEVAPLPPPSGAVDAGDADCDAKSAASASDYDTPNESE